MFKNDFESKFFKWLNKSVCNAPQTVVAFSFNLYDNDSDFSIELVGTDRFDADDADWACEEIYSPRKRMIDIPSSFAGTEWEACLDKIRQLIIRFINSDEPGATILNQSQGIGVGFVDGDLLLISKTS